ncbi:putative GPI-anchored protein pfl2, partial [Copidosoma floridanum]|uniref:putative GPI-anchored protein pfl2 n=1 Tax=Copidosoma floridanum TaxID=29053 RepID=UPI0006C999E7
SESIDADPSDGLSKSEARYSSTSSLSSAATASSPQTIQTSNTVKLISSNNRNSQSSPTSSITSASTNVTASSQTHIIKQVSSNNSRPRIVRSSCSPTFRPIVPSTMADKITITTSNAMTVMRPQTPQQFSPLQQQQQQHQLISQQQPVSVTQQQLHLPINTQVISTSPSLATFMPTHFGQQLRVIPADARPLIVQSNGTIATSSANGEQKSLLLVASNTSSNENRVTLLQSTLTYANNEGRPLLLTTHAPAISVTTAQTRIRTIEATQATSKRIGGVALVGGAGPELARLPGGAELNILPANGIFRSVKAPVTGVTLSHAGVSLQPTKPTTATHTTTLVQQTTSSNNGSIAPPSSGQQAAQQHHEGIQANCHLVTTQSGHQQLASLTPVIGPTMTVLSQGSNSQVILTPAGPLTGKVIGTPIIKAGQLMSAQYLTGVGKLGNPNVVIVNPNHQQHPAPASVQQSNNGPTSNGDSNVIASTRSPA